MTNSPDDDTHETATLISGEMAKFRNVARSDDEFYGQLAFLIRRALLAERFDCARIVDQYKDPPCPYVTDAVIESPHIYHAEIVRVCRAEISDAIRADRPSSRSSPARV